MSFERKLRRSAKRNKKLSSRKLDKTKVIKLVKTLLWVTFTFYFLIFGMIALSTYLHNKKVEEINLNPHYTSAKIVGLTRKGKNGKYDFWVKGINFNGSTNKRYSGIVGDSICIIYNRLKPETNIACEDKETSPVFETALMSSYFFPFIAIPFTVLYYLLSLFFGNKKLLHEITSTD